MISIIIIINDQPMGCDCQLLAFSMMISKPSKLGGIQTRLPLKKARKFVESTTTQPCDVRFYWNVV